MFSVIVIYNSPSKSSESFLQDFEKILEANQVLHPCVVVDERNVVLLKQNAVWKAYLKMFSTYGF